MTDLTEGQKIALAWQGQTIEDAEDVEALARQIDRGIDEVRRWLPIETAPRDRTPILLLTSDWGAVEGWWDASVTNFYKSQEGWASYDPENMRGDWVSHWNETDSEERRLFCGQTPHYWMPLPTPPKEAE